ncbi:MAG: hypothetical protein U0946_06910 [Patescibacteria group bacterium]|nr:hypothetical protein [Patescibacteria group bacterium]
MALALAEKYPSIRPVWFTEFWGTALTHFSYTNHEELLEVALGGAE